MLENRMNEFVSEDFEELIKEMKTSLLEKTKIQIGLNNIELVELVKTLGLNGIIKEVHSDNKYALTHIVEAMSILGGNKKEILTNYSSNTLSIDKETKIFTLDFDNLFVNEKKTHIITAEQSNLIVKVYAAIISNEKIKNRKQKEKEELLKSEKQKKIEEERTKKENEFNDFFKM